MAELTEKRKLGNLGEDLACRSLINRGFEIADRNYLKKWGEIDIVAINKGIIHFIEVKSVSCENIGQVSGENSGYRPEDNVHPWKLQRLSRAMQTYLLERRVSGETEWQVDIMTVHIDKKNLTSKISFIENIII